jgi:hypothetical protein
LKVAYLFWIVLSPPGIAKQGLWPIYRILILFTQLFLCEIKILLIFSGTSKGNRIFALVLPETFSMEQEKKSRGLYWLLFFISTAALLFAIYTHWEWLTLLLPFVTTFFVKAMDLL